MTNTYDEAVLDTFLEAELHGTSGLGKAGAEA